ncbi:MAG: hypothetical protein LAO31_11145 [Acidobacteriia bacterium]|nr:hypothetical protein [Terriglobia bacterium]
MRKMLLYLSVTFLMAIPLLGQEKSGGRLGPSPAPIPPSIKDKLASLLPEPAELGAERSGRYKFYSSDLYEYIDGAADGFHSYDLVALIHQEYKTQDAEITLDIYHMGKPLNAFGIYASERSPHYHFLPIGAEGYSDDYVLNFFQAEFYVKVSAFSEKGVTKPVMERFAQKVSQRIGSGRVMPEILALFPTENLVDHSQKFLNKSPLGHDFLGPAIMASYSFGGQEAALLISRAPDLASATQTVERLQKHFSRTGTLSRQPDLGAGSFRGSNPYEGDILFLSRGRYTILCLKPPSQPKAFLNAVVDHIEKAGADLTF